MDNTPNGERTVSSPDSGQRNGEAAPERALDGLQDRERALTPVELLCGVQGSGKQYLAQLADHLFRSAGWTRDLNAFVIYYLPPEGVSAAEAKRFSDSVMLRVYGIRSRGADGNDE